MAAARLAELPLPVFFSSFNLKLLKIGPCRNGPVRLQLKSRATESLNLKGFLHYVILNPQINLLSSNS